MECEIECCTGDNCNTKFPSESKGESQGEFLYLIQVSVLSKRARALNATFLGEGQRFALHP